MIRTKQFTIASISITMWFYSTHTAIVIEFKACLIVNCINNQVVHFLLPPRSGGDFHLQLTSLHAQTTRPTMDLFQSPSKSSMRL